MHAKLHRMSMYSELLAACLRTVGNTFDVGEHGGSDGPLLHELAECRSRLEAARYTAASDAPSTIARQIDYDLALVRLCRVHGIACDPASFTHPPAERRRLEEALEAAGADLWGAQGRERGSQPPDGSWEP
jgi:hypothetical protein